MTSTQIQMHLAQFRDQFRDSPTLEQAVEWALLRGYQAGRDDEACEWTANLQAMMTAKDDTPP